MPRSSLAGKLCLTAVLFLSTASVANVLVSFTPEGNLKKYCDYLFPGNDVRIAESDHALITEPLRNRLTQAFAELWKLTGNQFQPPNLKEMSNAKAKEEVLKLLENAPYYAKDAAERAVLHQAQYLKAQKESKSGLMYGLQCGQDDEASLNKAIDKLVAKPNTDFDLTLELSAYLAAVKAGSVDYPCQALEPYKNLLDFSKLDEFSKLDPEIKKSLYRCLPKYGNTKFHSLFDLHCVMVARSGKINDLIAELKRLLKQIDDIGEFSGFTDLMRPCHNYCMQFELILQRRCAGPFRRGSRFRQAARDLPR